MEKKLFVIALTVVIALFLIPVPMRLKDGGTVVYKAILYTVSDVHSIADLEEYEKGKLFNEGIIVKILGIEVFNNVR